MWFDSILLLTLPCQRFHSPNRTTFLRTAASEGDVPNRAWLCSIKRSMRIFRVGRLSCSARRSRRTAAGSHLNFPSLRRGGEASPPRSSPELDNVSADVVEFEDPDDELSSASEAGATSKHDAVSLRSDFLPLSSHGGYGSTSDRLSQGTFRAAFFGAVRLPRGRISA